MPSLPLTGAGSGVADPLAGYLVYDTFTGDDVDPLNGSRVYWSE